MADVVQKIIAGNPVRYGRSVSYVPHKGSLYQAGGYINGLPYTPRDIPETETQYQNRFDENLEAVVTYNTFDTRSQKVTSSAALLTGISDPIHSYLIKAAPGNTGVVYVGPAGVTANTSSESDGYPLSAGQELPIPIHNTGTVYVIGTGPSNQIFVLTT